VNDRPNFSLISFNRLSFAGFLSTSTISQHDDINIPSRRNQGCCARSGLSANRIPRKSANLGVCPTHHEFLDLDYIMDYNREICEESDSRLDNFDERIDDENDEMSERTVDIL